MFMVIDKLSLHKGVTVNLSYWSEAKNLRVVGRIPPTLRFFVVPMYQDSSRMTEYRSILLITTNFRYKKHPPRRNYESSYRTTGDISLG